MKFYRFKLPKWAWVVTVFGIISASIFNNIGTLGIILCMWAVEGRFANCVEEVA